VHRGHQAVIGEAGRAARDAGKPWAVLTFEPHPASVFRPDAPSFRLTPFRIKARQIEALGVDALVVLHFDPDFARLPADAFIENILVKGLGASHVVSGYDFVFGHGRRGDCEMLLHRGEMHGFGFTCVGAVKDGEGKVFSSTRVRDCLWNADPKGAAHVLGRAFEIEGRIEHGDARGRGIGFPTANLHLDDYIRPAAGVYAIRAGIDRGEETQWLNGVANLGIRPTFGGHDIVLEAHLFDFSGDLYGRHLRVALIDHIRPEKKFDGIADLKAQIAADCRQARKLLARP
ncbi:MAG: bifunctional riboflavin kinase/FAD synthetase, partial [Magnetospirillum sp. WYHS-4]